MSEFQDENFHDEERDYHAVLSDAAYLYGDNVASGKSREEAARIAEKSLRDYGYSDNIDIPTSGSGDVGTVFHGGHTGKAVLAYKGSSNKYDAIADAALASGSIHASKFSRLGMYNMAKKVGLGMIGKKDRFDRADDLFDATQKKYGKGNVGLTGHSLGGALAVMQGRRSNVRSISFNPGLVDAMGIGAEAEYAKKCGGRQGCAGDASQTIYTTGRDLVSSTGKWTGKGTGMAKDVVHDYSDRVGTDRHAGYDLPGVLQHSLGYFMPKKRESGLKSERNSNKSLSVNPNGHRDWDMGGKMEKNTYGLATTYHYPHYAERDHEVKHYLGGEKGKHKKKDKFEEGADLI